MIETAPNQTWSTRSKTDPAVSVATTAIAKAIATPRFTRANSPSPNAMLRRINIQTGHGIGTFEDSTSMPETPMRQSLTEP